MLEHVNLRGPDYFHRTFGSEEIMLVHPTLTQLTELGLAGMAKAFKELRDHPQARPSTPSGSPSCSIAKHGAA